MVFCLDMSMITVNNKFNSTLIMSFQKKIACSSTRRHELFSMNLAFQKMISKKAVLF